MKTLRTPRVLITLLAAGLFLAGCTTPPSENGGTPMSTTNDRPFDGTRSKEAMEKSYYDAIDATIQASGIPFPTWSRQDPVSSTDTIHQVPCNVNGQKGYKYDLTIRGESAPDPKATVEKLRKYWESQGWKIETTFDNTDLENPTAQISATSPDGIEITFAPIKNVTNPPNIGSSEWTRISARSDCSLDPALEPTSTPGSRF